MMRCERKNARGNCRGVVEADGFAWGKTPIDVGGKHPSLFRSPPPAPAIDSQRRLTSAAEKRATGRTTPTEEGGARPGAARVGRAGRRRVRSPKGAAYRFG